MTKIGILHPGEMGVSVAASALTSGHPVYWVSDGRSEKTRSRAGKHGLIDIGSLSKLCRSCEIILCICPPHSAEEVAEMVISKGYQGCYLDANAISPQRAVRIGQMMERKGIRFVDGGIIGGPAWKPKETRLYLSGREASRVAECFSKGSLETGNLGDEVGRASALKMCYAAYTKGTTALLAAILAAAESLGVRDELYWQWDRDDPGFSERTNRRVRNVTAKAWRFEGEMEEIAATLQEAGLPDGFHKAAAEVFHRLAGFKDESEFPELEDVLKSLL